MGRLHNRRGLETWVLQAFLGMSLVFVSLLVAEGLGFLHQGHRGLSIPRSGGAPAAGTIRPAAMKEFQSGKFSTKEAWFYHRVDGQAPSKSPGIGEGGVH